MSCDSDSHVTHLPHADNGVSDEDEEDDKGLHEGGDGLLAFLKPGQHLEEDRPIRTQDNSDGLGVSVSVCVDMLSLSIGVTEGQDGGG